MCHNTSFLSLLFVAFCILQKNGITKKTKGYGWKQALIFLFYIFLLWKLFDIKVIDETLSPTWDELMLFPEVLIYGRREDIKSYPPSIIIEIYDQDKVNFFSYSFESGG